MTKPPCTRLASVSEGNRTYGPLVPPPGGDPATVTRMDEVYLQNLDFRNQIDDLAVSPVVMPFSAHHAESIR